MIGPAIRQVLLETPPIAALVGDRVRPLSVAQLERRPFVVYSATGENRGMTLTGPAQHTKPSLEVTSYADSYDGCQQLADQVKSKLAGLSQDTDHGNIRVCIFEDESDIETAAPQGQEKPAVYVRTQFYRTLFLPL